MAERMPSNRTALLLISLLILIATPQIQAQDLDALMKVQPGRSQAITSTDPNYDGNYDRIHYVHPNETRTLADIKGPGVIRHIWLTFNEARPNWLEAGGSAAPNELVLRMYWDGAKEPAVEAPIGDFFGAGFGKRLEIKSAPVQVEGGDGYNCYWAMPFFKRALITVTNEGDKNCRSFYYHIDYTEEDSLPKETAYFCAQYNQAFPEILDEDYLIADIQGQGHYVGTVMSARSRSPFWFGEGDVRLYIDGDTTPSFQGTGTEDYFLMAWGLAPTLYPYYGCTYMSSDFEDLGTEYCLYRWHITDPVRFRKSLRFEIEHTGWITGDETESGNTEGHVEREDDIATVAFWYQIDQPKRFTKLPPLAKRILPNIDLVIEGKDLLPTAKHSTGILELQKGYDWTGDGQLLYIPASDDPVLEVEFEVQKEDYRGLMLRMSYGPEYGTYRIFLDGKNIAQPEDYMAGEKIDDYDFYAKTLYVRDHYLGSFKFVPGKHSLRFEYIGRNPFSKGRHLGVDSVRLRQRWDRKRKKLSALPTVPMKELEISAS